MSSRARGMRVQDLSLKVAAAKASRPGGAQIRSTMGRSPAKIPVEPGRQVGSQVKHCLSGRKAEKKMSGLDHLTTSVQTPWGCQSGDVREQPLSFPSAGIIVTALSLPRIVFD